MHFFSIGICGTGMFIYLIHEFIYHKKVRVSNMRTGKIFIYLFKRWQHGTCGTGKTFLFVSDKRFWYLSHMRTDKALARLHMQLTRYQRRQYQRMQTEIFRLWTRYSSGEVSATGLLKQLSTKYKPAVGGD